MIIAYRDLINDDITVDNVKARLKDMFKGERDLIPTTDDIIEEVAKYCGMLTPEDVKGQSKMANIVLARHIATYLVRKITNLSLKDIGNEFGGRHHTTVMASVKLIEKRMKDDKEFYNEIRDITSIIDTKNR